MEFIKRHFKTINDDLFLALSVKIDVILIGLHLYQYIDSELTINPLIRLIACCTYPLVIFFAGRKGCYFYFFLYGNCLALQTTFQNYTGFLILCIFIMLVPKMKYLTLSLYAIDIVAVATMHGKTPVHLLIHGLNCVMFYFALNFLLNLKVSKKQLELTNDEILIIEELLKGKQQKEIELFSQNTVTSKLKQARERNNVATTDELLVLYRKQN